MAAAILAICAPALPCAGPEIRRTRQLTQAKETPRRVTHKDQLGEKKRTRKSCRQPTDCNFGARQADQEGGPVSGSTILPAVVA
jgi:hypothetical protein